MSTPWTTGLARRGGPACSPPSERTIRNVEIVDTRQESSTLVKNRLEQDSSLTVVAPNLNTA